jgi:hypothetical protein
METITILAISSRDPTKQEDNPAIVSQQFHQKDMVTTKQ